jgi:hypothetical protein
MATQFKEAVTWLLEHEAGKLSTWELDFLDSIEGRASLTPKQQGRLDDLWREIVVEKRRDDETGTSGVV